MHGCNIFIYCYLTTKNFFIYFFAERCATPFSTRLAFITLILLSHNHRALDETQQWSQQWCQMRMLRMYCTLQTTQMVGIKVVIKRNACPLYLVRCMCVCVFVFSVPNQRRSLRSLRSKRTWYICRALACYTRSSFRLITSFFFIKIVYEKR